MTNHVLNYIAVSETLLFFFQKKTVELTNYLFSELGFPKSLSLGNNPAITIHKSVLKNGLKKKQISSSNRDLWKRISGKTGVCLIKVQIGQT